MWNLLFAFTRGKELFESILLFVRESCDDQRVDEMMILCWLNDGKIGETRRGKVYTEEM